MTYAILERCIKSALWTRPFDSIDSSIAEHRSDRSSRPTQNCHVASSPSRPVLVARDLSASFLIFSLGACPQRENLRRGSVSRRLADGLDDPAGWIIVCEPVGTEEDGEKAVRIFVDTHRRSDEV